MSAQTSTHTALQALLSTQSIPSKLVSQAESLVTLSRQRAPNLKSEEEIARTHACAEIAAKRNRVSLRLPSVKSGAGAPAKPGVYKKLVVFFERILGDAGSITPTSERKRLPASNGGTPTSSVKRARLEKNYIDELEGTPTKKRRTTQATGFVGKVRDMSNSNANFGGYGSSPDYVMPSIRKLCRSFDTQSLAPHTFTGVCVILKEAEIWPVTRDRDGEEQETSQENVLALTIAVYLMVLTKMKKGKMTTSEYSTTSAKAVSLLGLQPEESIRQNIEHWIGKINSEGWATERDWWDSVPESVITFSNVQSGSTETLDNETSKADRDNAKQVDVWHQKEVQRSLDIRKRLKETDPEGILLPGLGTMMQDAVDFFGEERKADQAHWKADIERRMNIMDKQASRRGKGIISA